MSKSRSPTPTSKPAVTTSFNTTAAAAVHPPPSSSRLEISNVTTSIPFALNPIHVTSSTSPHRTHSSSSHHPTSESQSHHSTSSSRHIASSPTASSSMARRFSARMTEEQRRVAASAVARRSSPSSDSQGGMADTEMEGAQHSEEQSPPRAVPKKKRTRTLTTPHQAQVLHALLAKSRFPSTAVREEVGRSIGLSARKVQIWFQNQRQKARRPRSQSAQPTTRLPQYGSFQGAPGRGSEISPIASTVGLSGLRHDHTPAVHSSYSSRESLAEGHQPYRSLEPQHLHHEGSTSSVPTQLSGPGIPGESRSTSFIYRERDPSDTRPTPISLDVRSPIIRHAPYPGFATRHSISPTYTRSRYSPTRTLPPPGGFRDSIQRPSTSSTILSARRINDPSRTLPPLVFPPTSSHSRLNFRSTSGPSSSRPSPIYPSVSPTDSIFAHDPPSLSLPVVAMTEDRPSMSSSSERYILPPPFSLQPSPQWDSATWSTHGSYHSIVGSTYAASPRGRQHLSTPERLVRNPETSMELLSSPLSNRPSSSRLMGGGSTRYDPVRGTMVPYPSPPAPSATTSQPLSYFETGSSSNHSIREEHEAVEARPSARDEYTKQEAEQSQSDSLTPTRDE